jgi:hypothetical protein
MGLLLTTIAGLVVWVVLWSIDVKSFDAFMITIGMVVVAAAFRVFGPAAPGKARRRGGRPQRLEPTLTQG